MNAPRLTRSLFTFILIFQMLASLVNPAGATATSSPKVFPELAQESRHVPTSDLVDIEPLAPALPSQTTLEVSILSTPWAVLDNNSPGTKGPQVFVVEARITNTGSETAVNLEVALNYNEDPLNNWILLPGENTLRTTSTKMLAPGATYYAYWFARYSSVIGGSHTYTVTAKANNAPLVSTSDNFYGNPEPGKTIKTRGTLSTGNSGISQVSSSVVVGVAFTVTVTYDLGSNPLDITFSPVGNTDFDPSQNRLVSSRVRFYNDAGTFEQIVDNRLYFPTLDSRAENAQISFVFLPLKISNTKVCPYAAVGYSSNHKYDQFFCNPTKGTSIPIQGTLSYTFKKQVSKLVAQQGETITYTIRYTNTGTSDLTNAWIWDDLDPLVASAVLASVQPAYATGTTTHRVIWYLGTIPKAGNPGSSGVLTFAAIIDGGGSDKSDGTNLVNVASFGISPGTLPTEAAVTTSATTTIQAPTIAIQKTDGLATVEPGTVITYTVQVNNNGSVLATNVVITDVLPSDVTLSGTPSPAPTTQDGQVLVWNNLGPVSAGGVINIKIPAVVGIKTPDGTALTNTASMTYSNQAGHKFTKKTAIDATTVAGPLLSISKIDTPDPVLAGKWITYTLSYANSGPGSATHVTITDNIPVNTTYQTCGGAVCSQSGGVVTWDIGSIPTKGSGTVTFSVLVSDLLATGTLIHNNTYSIVSDQTDSVAGTPITTLVNRNAAFFIGSTFVDLNGNGVFDVGEGTLSGITVTLPSATTPVVNTTGGAYRFRVETEGMVTISASDWPGYFRTTSASVNVQSTLGITQTVNFGYAPLNSGFGVLYGTVYEDANYNGILDSGERGLSGVQISSTQATTPTVSTNLNGQYTLRFNAEGDVTVTETNPTGYVSITPDTISTPVDLGSSNASPVNFGDFHGIKITGQVFNDLNVNGAKDSGEDGLSGARVAAGSNNFTTTSTGVYTLYTSVAGSPILITETNPDGYVSTNAVPGIGMVRVSLDALQIIAPVAGNTYTGGDFGDALASGVVTISGQVWDDNGAGGGGLANGMLDGTESGLAGAVITLSSGLTQTTGSSGTFSLYAPPNQQVTLTETNPAGYTSTNAIPGNNASKVNNDTLVIEALGSGASSSANLFGDVLPAGVAVITGTVFNDQNQNGLIDIGEPGISGTSVTMEISGGNSITVQTGLNGNYQFAVAPGTDIRISSAGPGAGFYPTTPQSVVARPPAAGVYPGNNFGYSNNTDRMVIYGLVYDDLNSNGQVDFGELGLPGAVIWLNETISVTTNSSGILAGSFTFSFPVVTTPRLYAIREVNPAGYRSTTPDILNIPIFPSVSSYYIDFGDTNNQNIASLYGVVFDDLNRNGAYDINEPNLPGVAITLTVGATQGKVMVTTKSYGQFSYGFVVEEAGYHTLTEQDPAKPGYHSTTPDSVNLFVQLGNSYLVDFGDTQEGYVVYGTVFNDSSGDGVQNVTELGISGVTVSLSSGAQTTTNVDGGYTFDIPAPGLIPYSLQVIETDPTGFHSTTPNSTLFQVISSQRSYKVNFGDTNNQFVSSIFGTVFDDLNVNGAYDLEPGLPGITLTIGTIVNYSSITNEWGQFTFAVEATGVYTVTETDALGWVSTNAIPGSAAVTKVDPNTLRVTVQNLGTGFDSNRFGDALATQVVEISGSVWNDNGDGGGTLGDGIRNGAEPGLAGAAVSLSSGTSQVTGGDGLFKLYGPAGQVITIQEQNPGGFTSSGSVAGSNASRVNNDTLTVNALGGGGVSSGNQFGDVATSSVAVITGIVFNDANGDGILGGSESGISNVTVKLDGTSTTVTDGSGHYSFLTPLAGTHQVVETDRAGYFSTTPNEVHITVSLGGSFTVNFGDSLNNSGFASIFGTVFEDINGNAIWDADEVGIPGVIVRLDNSLEAVTDPNGSYTFSTNVAGNHTVVEIDLFAYVSTTPNQVNLSVSLGQGYQADFGDRQLCYCIKDGFEEDDVYTQASTILVGVANKQAHNFCDDAVDWIAFTAQARGTYTITTWAKGLRADTYLELYDKDGQTLLKANDDFAGTTDYSSRITWIAPTSGTYYVKVSNRSTLIRCSTDYEVWVESQPAKLIYMPFVSKMGVGPSSPEVVKDATIEVKPASPNPGRLLGTINLGELPLPGVYEPSSAIAPLGVITHTCPDAYEVDDTWEQARSILPGIPQVHSFDSNPALYAADKDLVSFNVKPGDIVTFTTALTNTQVLLELFDKNGTALGVSGSNQLTWTATGYGPYYLSASSQNNNFGCANVAGYVLTMELFPRKWLYMPMVSK